MSNQNRFLLPHSSPASSAPNARNQSAATAAAELASSENQPNDEQENNQHSVDTDFDSYWEEEARNPHRNRIRIGRQYQATVPPLLKAGEKDNRRLEDLETLSFCPKRSAKVSDAELEHYFTIAKSLNLFASLVETRSLLGRDVTIADLNHIRNKEGLSLASVIQPPARQTPAHAASTSNPNILLSPLAVSSQQSANNNQPILSHQLQQQSSQKSPPAVNNCDRPSSSSSSSSNRDQANHALNQPLMKALSHFISLHHPCHHDRECKKLQKEIPLEDDSEPSVSITAGNLRQGASTNSKDGKHVRSRSAMKQAAMTLKEEVAEKDSDEPQQASRDSAANSPSFEDWTREEVELFSKAIEVCGKNFGSIKKEFLPSKSVRSIVEYYYIGSRDVTDNKKKSSQAIESGDGCSSSEKATNNNSHSGGGGGGSGGSLSSTGKTATNNIVSSSSNATATSSSGTAASNSGASNSNKTISDSNEVHKRPLSDAGDIQASKANQNSKISKLDTGESNGLKNKAKTIDARMSVYNFDEEFKDESPVQFECSRPGAEVKPLKAKPIIPHTSLDSNAANSNVGSLKFFMDGQLVLKLNACQDQQEGIEKCHWVQSGDKVVNASRQKRYTKRSEKSTDLNQNGSQSNSVVSSFQDDDSKIDDLSGDEDSKESLNSVTNLTQQKNSHRSPTPKRPKTKSGELNMQQAQLPSPINYNRMAVNNRIKERSDNLNTSPVINQSMQPWLQASSFAVAAALLGGLPFPAADNLNDNTAQNSINNVNMASKPMDLSLEHSAPKSLPKPSSRSRSRPRNN